MLKKTCLLAIVFSLVLVAAPEKKTKPLVMVETAKAEKLFDVLAYPARVSPTVNAALISEIDGIVESVSVPLGGKVAKGHRVFALKNTDPIYKYAPVSVVSPVNGVVSQVEVTQGSRVTRGQKLGQITDPTKLKIEIEVPAFDLASLGKGLRGQLRVPNQEGTFDVKINGISPFVDPTTGSSTAELSLQKGASPLLLPPGLVGQVSFRVREHEGIQIPEHALYYRGESTFVRTVEEEKVKLLPVTVGRARRGFLEIEKGLTPGNQVIVRTSQYIAEGEEVTAENPGAKSE